MTATLSEQISDCIDLYVAKAKEAWPNKLKDWNKPFWCFNLQGTTAGTAYYHANKIHLNHGLFIRNKEDFFSHTIPHEIAHLVSYRVFGKVGMGHGAEWKFVMRVFGVEANRLHTYDVSETKMKRTITRHLYTCGCSSFVHELTPKQHQKETKKKHTFSCKKCDCKLTNLDKIKSWVQ